MLVGPVIPSKPTPAAEQICAPMGLSLTITPYQRVQAPTETGPSSQK